MPRSQTGKTSSTHSVWESTRCIIMSDIKQHEKGELEEKQKGIYYVKASSLTNISHQKVFKTDRKGSF